MSYILNQRPTDSDFSITLGCWFQGIDRAKSMPASKENHRWDCGDVAETTTRLLRDWSVKPTWMSRGVSRMDVAPDWKKSRLASRRAWVSLVVFSGSWASWARRSTRWRLPRV